MKRVKEDFVINKIHKAVLRTGVLNYIATNMTLEKCQTCDKIRTVSENCYDCLISNNKLKSNLSDIISRNSTENVYAYQEFLQNKSIKLRDSKFSKLADVIEADLYRNLL